MVRVLKGKERKNTRLADRIKAAEWLADRGYGKAVDFHADIGEGNTLRELAKEVVRLELQGDAKTPANQTK